MSELLPCQKLIKEDAYVRYDSGADSPIFNEMGVPTFIESIKANMDCNKCGKGFFFRLDVIDKETGFKIYNDNINRIISDWCKSIDCKYCKKG